MKDISNPTIKMIRAQKMNKEKNKKIVVTNQQIFGYIDDWLSKDLIQNSKILIRKEVNRG
ncbi:hypothetical protein AMS59_12060 [Lysinibacillus sp. FJAT-14745]|nr:hypothetical protein AMS59_12060 [Lysinibacillus sp. FJAT-14745]